MKSWTNTTWCCQVYEELHAQWSSDDRRQTLWTHDLSINYCAHCLDPFWTCICIHHRSAEIDNQMILISNKMCEESWQSNELININGLHTTLVITVLMPWSNTIAYLKYRLLSTATWQTRIHLQGMSSIIMRMTIDDWCCLVAWLLLMFEITIYENISLIHESNIVALIDCRSCND